MGQYLFQQSQTNTTNESNETEAEINDELFINPKDTTKDTRDSLLTLICPGLGGNGYGKGRKMAIKTDNKQNDIDPSEKNIKGATDLGGCDQDNATITEWFKNRSKDIGCAGYKSNQSICDAQLTVQEAIKRIKKWLQEENVTDHIFYFSGHGTDKNGGGICFKDGVLLYSDLVATIEKYKTNVQWCDRFTFIIDACHSGCIHKYVEKQSKESVRICGCAVDAFYSCKKEEVSADYGTSGGYFTSKYFTKYQHPARRGGYFTSTYFTEYQHAGRNGYFTSNYFRSWPDPSQKTVIHEYNNNTTSPQTCGYARNRCITIFRPGNIDWYNH